MLLYFVDLPFGYVSNDTCDCKEVQISIRCYIWSESYGIKACAEASKLYNTNNGNVGFRSESKIGFMCCINNNDDVLIVTL